MPSEVIVPDKTLETKKAEMELWLKDNAGVGSHRHGGREGHIKHWLSGDDWLCYNQYSVGDLDSLGHLNTVFVFKDERVATEFALRFA